MAEPDPRSPPPPARGAGAPRWLLRALAVVAVLAVLLLAPLAWLTRSEGGTVWLLGKLPYVKVEGPRGTLFGDFDAERVEIDLPGGSDRVLLTKLSWRHPRLEQHWPSFERVALRLESLSVERVDLQFAPKPSSGPPSAPGSLRLPVEFEVGSLHIGELHAAALGGEPLRRLQAHLHAGAEGGSLHRVDALSLAYDRMQAEGRLQIASDAPFAVQADVVVTPDPSRPAPPDAGLAADFRLQLKAQGPLDALQAQASVRGAALPGRPAADAPAADAKATLRPFAAWPLGALEITTQALDLSALVASAPATALSGRLQVDSAGMDAPATLVLALENGRAGRVDDGLLPLRSLHAEVGGRPDDTTSAELRRFEAALGSADEAAGVLQGSGRWAERGATLALTLADLQPHALDRRAPEMRLGGRIDLQGRQLIAAPGGAPAAPKGSVQAALTGSLQWDGRSQDVALDLDAAGDAARVDLRRASARAGASRAELTGHAEHAGGDAAAGWHVDAAGSLADLDPRVWWPGPAGSAWRAGPHRFNAALKARLDLPDDLAARPSLPARLAALRGDATLNLTRSVLAGAPLAGEIGVRNADGRGATGRVDLTLAGAALQASGRWDAQPRGAQDQWDLRLQHADLQQLAPVLRLVPVAALQQAAGVIDLQAHGDGRWPAMRTNGRADLQRLAVAGAALDDGHLRWNLGTAANAALELQADLRGLRGPQGSAGAAPPASASGATSDAGSASANAAPSLDEAHLVLTGTQADHRLSLSLAAPLRPPAWVDELQGPARGRDGQPVAVSGTRPADGSLVELRAQGALKFDPAWKQPLQWHGRVQRLDLQGRHSPAPAWLSLGETPLDLQYDPLTATPRVAAGAGRAQLPGAALRWSELRWQGGAKPVFDAQAELEPLGVAPLLARLQPDFGWGGDLVVGGHLELHSAPTLAAKIELARVRGDLHVADEAGSGSLVCAASGPSGAAAAASGASAADASSATNAATLAKAADATPAASAGAPPATDAPCVARPGGQTLPLGLNQLRMALDVDKGVWQATLAFAGTTLGAMAGAVTVRTDPALLMPAQDAPLQGVLEATVANLGAWGAWVPTGWRMAGRVHASATIGGRFGAPEYTGTIDGSGLGVRNLLEGVDLHDGTLAVKLGGKSATIERFDAKAGQGSMKLSGEAEFGASPKAQIKLVADHLLVLGRVDRRIVASGNADLGLDAEALRLDGDFKVDEGLVDISRGDAPTLGDDVEVLRDKAPPKPPPATNERPRAVAMNVSLDLGEQLRLKGRGIDTRLAGKLKISAPQGKLAVNGVVRTVQGTYAAYRQNLEIERGLIVFSGPTDNPRLDILAVRPNLDTRVGVAVTGTALSPRVRLYSDPDMSDTDKLSWLVLGRAPDSLGRSDTALLQSAALALLAGEGSSPTDDLTKRLGLDELSFSQSEGEVRETIVSLGKRISDRWYVGYERSLTATAGSWQLIYRVARRFTLRAQSGADNSLDAIWTWRWQ